MTVSSFQWPVEFLGVVVICFMAAAVAPWVLRRSQPSKRRILAPGVGATVLWFVYEATLMFLAPAGDPLIRVDLLFIILPLMAVAWMSGIIACPPRSGK